MSLQRIKSTIISWTGSNYHPIPSFPSLLNYTYRSVFFLYPLLSLFLPFSFLLLPLFLFFLLLLFFFGLFNFWNWFWEGTNLNINSRKTLLCNKKSESELRYLQFRMGFSMSFWDSVPLQVKQHTLPCHMSRSDSQSISDKPIAVNDQVMCWSHVHIYFLSKAIFVHKKYVFKPNKDETCHEKTCICHMRTTKAQISLRICAVWSAPLLFVA